MRRFLESLALVTVLLATLCVLHRRAAFADGLLAPFDILGAYEPWKSALDAGRPENPALSDQVTLHPWTPLAAHRLIEQGVPTSWNPYQGCGTPLHGNTLSAQLYPLMWLHALLSRHGALLAIGLAKGLLTGFFFWLLLRRRGVSPLGAAFGALALPLSGFYVVWFGHQQTIVASLLPLLLWLTDRAVDRPSGPRLALVGIVSGATLLAGHLETALHVLLISTGYGGLRCLAESEPLGSRLARLAKLILGYAIGAAISMGQVLPFLEYSLNSAILPIRHHPLYRFHNAWRDLAPAELLPAAASIVALVAAIFLVGRLATALREKRDAKVAVLALLATVATTYAFTQAFALGLLDHLDLLLDPDRHGSPLANRASGAYVGYLLYVEMNCGYASIAALPLAIAALALRRKGDLATLFLGAMLFVSLAIVFEWPLVAHAISRTPIFAEAKNKRLLLASSLATLWLAAKGIDLLRAALRDGDLRATLAPLLACAILALGIVGGRRLSPPSTPVGPPGVPVADPALDSIAAGFAPRLARGELAAHIVGLLPERARTERQLALDGVVALPADTPSLALDFTGVAHTARAALELSASADERLAGITHRFHATVDTASWPTGRYAVAVVGLDAAGQPKGRVACGAVYVSRPATKPRTLAIGIATLALLGLLCAGLARGAPWLLAALAIADLFWFADGFNPAVDRTWDFPSTPALEFVTREIEPAFPMRVTANSPQILPANVATAYRIADTRNYDSIDIATYNTFLSLFAKPTAEGPTRAALDTASPFFELLAARFVLDFKGAPTPPNCERAYDGEIAVFRHTRALPRAFVAPRAVTMGAVIAAAGGDPNNPDHRGLFPDAFARVVKSGMLDLATTIVVPDEDAARFGAVNRLEPDPSLARPIPARFVVDDFDRLVIETESATAGVLFLADAYLPGWVAAVDDADSTPCSRAHLTFRAVPIPAGKHRVEFRYESSFARAGFLTLIGGLVAALVASLYGFVAHRPKR